jgi:hypothetical protein
MKVLARSLEKEEIFFLGAKKNVLGRIICAIVTLV